MGTNLLFEADDILAFKHAMEKAGFEQHELALLSGNHKDKLSCVELWKDIRKLVNGQATAIHTTHLLPSNDGKTDSSTIERRDGDLYHNGRRLSVLRCRELKDVLMYADLAAYFKPEAHPPIEVLNFLSENSRLIPADWNLHMQSESWVIFMSTRFNDRVTGLSSSFSIHQGWWAAGDTDGLESMDHVVVYEDAI